MIDRNFACNKPRAYIHVILKFFTGKFTLPSMWRLREDWQRLHTRLQHNIYCELAAKAWIKTVTQI